MDKNILTNRFCGVLVCTIMLFVAQAFALDCKTGTGWGDFLTESVTPDDSGFYRIDTPEQLAWFSCVTIHNSSTYGSAKVLITDNINLDGKLFIPISAGTGTPKFTGTIDGQGHTIRGLYIKGSEIANNSKSDITGKSKNGAKAYTQNIGLVAVLSTGGKIKNLVLEVSDIYASTSAGDDGTVGTNNPISVGALVGWMEDGEITNCIVEGNITTSGDKNRVGGLVGNVKSATISDCVSMVSISSSGKETHVGGVVGALRNGGTVNLSSCVFEGDTLISTGGKVGGIVGNYENSNVKTQDALYYTGNYPGVGNGSSITTHKENDLNTEQVVCELNRGSWIDSSQSCSGDTSDVWSEGQSDVSLNGSDGYKVSFNANGGTFGSGAKTFKIVANGATITADEITEPTRTNKKFAGWATTDDAEKPTELGVANSNKTLYAVWYDYYTVTFEIDSKTHETRSVVVPKHGHVSVEGFSVPTVFYDKISDTVSVKYYFTGWGLEAKWLGVYVDPSTGDTVKIDPTPSDTLHLADIDVVKDTALYPVWTQAETYSVTFDATLHGKTYVHFVKKVSEGDTVARPNDVVTNPGYSIEEWCTDADCTEGSVYVFSSKLKSNLTLYAKWKLESYAITYVMNGGKNNVANPDSFTVESDSIIFAKPTYDGNTFGGWFYDAGFTSPATGIATGSTTGNKTLYAKWTPIVYTIEYLSGNDASATVVADRKAWGDTLTLKGNEVAFQREGYIHDGWSLTDGGSKVYNFGDSYSQDKDLILYPHWVAESPVAAQYGAVTIYTYPDTHKEAVINGDYKGADTVKITSDIEVSSVTLDRTFNVNKISTLYVPFEIDTANVKNATVYKFKRVVKEENLWKFKVAKAGKVMPNTPYVVLPSASQVTFDIAESVTLNTTTEGEETTSGAWEFKGLYNYTKFVMDDENPIYVFANQECSGAKLGEFVMTTEGAWSNPMRAYLVYHKGTALAKSALGDQNSFLLPSELDIEIEDENGVVVQTGKLNTVTGEVRMDRWFDLKGRSLNSKPTAKGTYYKNGKKTIIR